VDYLVRAAAHAAQGWAKGEAVGLYAEALELIPPEDRDSRRDIALSQAMTLVELGDLTNGIPLLDSVLPELEGRVRLEALLSRGRAAFWAMDAATVRRLSLEAFELAQELGEEELLGPALALRSEAESMEGRMEPAFELGRRASEVWTPGTRRMDHAQFLDQVALDRYWTGEYAAAEQIAREVLALAEEIKSTDALLRTGGVYGVILTAQGRHEEALPVFEAAIARGRDLEFEPRWTARALNMSSAPYRDLFDLDEARARNEEAAELGARAGFAIAEVQGGIDHIFADLIEGELGRADARWPELWERTQAAKGWHQWLMAGRLTEAKAEIALARGDFEAAATAADRAVRDSAEVSRRKYETAARLVLGRALLGLGQRDRAVAELRAATDAAEGLFHPPTRWRAWSALSEALLATGDDDGAAAAHTRASNLIREFAATLQPERAERLLAAEPVRAILSADGSG
ncbi:MAG TPA: hypothetical protein VKA30_08125, partial [Actinomycetota bacterium]|nr:hypothetical protein [Actinomycetota bacterium]